MKNKYKIVFFNFMIFLIIFDLIYIFVWIFSMHMNPVKAILIAGIALLLTPWIRQSNLQDGRKIVVRSYVYSFINKYRRK
ncbi:MAG: hypothetical protein WCI54_05740 [Bacteroidia bacterium]|jgi:c-di-AMP phosphodiesterase-like protein